MRLHRLLLTMALPLMLQGAAAFAYGTSRATPSPYADSDILPPEGYATPPVSKPHQMPIQDELELPLRERAPGFIGLTVGDPSPSWIGVDFGYQLSWMIQLMGSAGYFHWEDFTMGSAAAQGRLHILPTKLTPFVGGGMSFYFISGDGKFQGLHTTTFMLPFINAGLDWIFESGFRIAAGVNFHFPVKLNFPFVNLGFSF